MQAVPIVKDFHFSAKNPTPKLIVTHTNPDLDAIGYAWLMAKYAPGFGAYRIEFTAFGQDRDLIDRADSVGDIGGVYDPARRRFDHHQLPGAESTATCATRMTWDWLQSQGIDVAHLEPLVEIIHQGDLGRQSPVGLHGLLQGFAIRFKKNTGQRLSDQELMAWGFELIDCSATWLRRQAKVKAELAEKVLWKSEDGLIWAIQSGSTETSFAAYEQGARLVVFFGEPIELPNGTTYPVGVSRAPEWQEPDISILIYSIIIHSTSHSEVITEMESWFVHPAGFFAGRGTAKGPMYEKPKCSLLNLASVIDTGWLREVAE